MNAGAFGTLDMITTVTTRTLRATATTVKCVRLGCAQETHPRFAEVQAGYYPIASLTRECWLQKLALSSSNAGAGSERRIVLRRER